MFASLGLNSYDSNNLIEMEDQDHRTNQEDLLDPRQ